MTVSREMPIYKSHKTVWALKIKDVTGCTITPVEDGYAPFEVPSELYLRYTPSAGDYFVVYADGYRSFSPAKAFDEGYTLVIQETATDGGLRPHEQRVVDEKNELRCRLAKLFEFLQGPIFDTLDSFERSRLRNQASLMDRYAAVLEERIAAFGNAVERFQ